MKKLFLSLAMASATALSAQIEFSQTRFGLTAGANYSGVKNAHNPSGKRLGFQAGGLALIPFENNDDQFYLQTEVNYHQAGETGYNKKEGGNKNTKYYNNYISVPVYFKAYFSEAESEFFGMLGPKFNFLVGQKVEAPAMAGYATSYTGAGDGKAKFLNFAIGAGVGFSYKRQWELALKYDFGLSDTYPNLRYYEQELSERRGRAVDPNTLKKSSEQVVSITLSYIFD